VTRVAVGGKISNRKGVNLPDTEIPVAAMTEKDRTDLEAAIDAGVDWIGMSFVQRPEDVAEGRKMARGRALIMTKLEKPQAMARLDDIMEASDALMVARGDLGVEMPLEKGAGPAEAHHAPGAAHGQAGGDRDPDAGEHDHEPGPDPRRGVGRATAVFEGADAIMLSAESASGQYPLEAVATMNRIAEEVEQDAIYWSIIAAQRTTPEATGSDAIAAASHQIADTLGCRP
jgi:pyruvate kinase